jgi:transcriptional regulator with XRE-family HTH domain
MFMETERLGSFIRRKRRELEITQAGLAEQGKQTPSREVINAIAKVFKLPSSKLFTLLSEDEEKEVSPNGAQLERPKSRIPDLPPDPPLEPELQAILDDPNIGIFFSKPYLARLSNRQLRQIALNIKMMIDENEERGQ